MIFLNAAAHPKWLKLENFVRKQTILNLTITSEILRDFEIANLFQKLWRYKVVLSDQAKWHSSAQN